MEVGDGCASVRADSWTEILHYSEHCLKSPVVPLGPHCLSKKAVGGPVLGRQMRLNRNLQSIFFVPPPEPTAAVLGTVESTSLPWVCLWTYRAFMQSRRAEELQQKLRGNTPLQTTLQSSGKHLSMDQIWIRGGIGRIISVNPSACPNSVEKIWQVIEWFTGNTHIEKAWKLLWIGTASQN